MHKNILMMLWNTVDKTMLFLLNKEFFLLVNIWEITKLSLIIHFSKSTKMISFHTLPIEIIYRVLDHLNEINILWSARNICIRLNRIIDTYDRYKVNIIDLISTFINSNLFPQRHLLHSSFLAKNLNLFHQKIWVML